MIIVGEKSLVKKYVVVAYEEKSRMTDREEWLQKR